VVDCCVHGKETLGSMKRGESRDQLLGGGGL
jgi:hypothetical protein